MTDRSEQGGALLDVALQALPHVEEGVSRLAHLARAVGLEVEISAPAKGLGRLGQPLDGPDLVADEGHGHADQDQGRRRRP